MNVNIIPINSVALGDLKTLGVYSKKIYDELGNTKAIVTSQKQRYANFTGNKEFFIRKEMSERIDKLEYYLKELNSSFLSLDPMARPWSIDFRKLIKQWQEESEHGEI